jgi:hypothetical protein
MAIQCRKCGRSALQCLGYLQRVNALGEIGEWECRPNCGVRLSREDAIIAAIESTEPVVFTNTPIVGDEDDNIN